MRAGRRAGEPLSEHRIDRWVSNIEHGRFERSLSGVTALAAALDGYQYADLPDDRVTWTLVLTGLDEQAVALYGHRFADSEPQTREALLRQFAAGQLDRGAWERLNVTRAWSVCMRMVLEAFYSHPWAWNEIGFGGAAYPRGYMRLGGSGGAREPFERPGATDEDPVAVAPELER